MSNDLPSVPLTSLRKGLVGSVCSSEEYVDRLLEVLFDGFPEGREMAMSFA